MIHAFSAAPDLTSSRIKNPLVGIPKHQLIADVDAFANEHGLQDIRDLMIKGALISQAPSRIDSISELDDSDRAEIIDEVAHKWRQPKALYFTIFLNSIAAAIQGWDQTGKYGVFRQQTMLLTRFSGSNGANIGFPQDLGIPDTPETCLAANGCNADRNSWLVGVVNAAPYFTIMLV